MDDRALHDALEAGGRFGVLAIVGDQIVEIVVDIGDESAAQRFESTLHARITAAAS